jgi:hypothetical protein
MDKFLAVLVSLVVNFGLAYFIYPARDFEYGTLLANVHGALSPFNYVYSVALDGRPYFAPHHSDWYPFWFYFGLVIQGISFLTNFVSSSD